MSTKDTRKSHTDTSNKDLRLLHVSQKPRKTTARAYEAIAMDDWRSNVEHNLNQMNIGQEDLATALSATMRDNMSIATTHPGDTITIPSAITAGSSLTNDQYRQMKDELIDAMHTALRTKSGGEIKLYKYYKNRFMKNLSLPSNIQKALTTTTKGPLNRYRKDAVCDSGATNHFVPESFQGSLRGHNTKGF
jgi:hypothetical protein